MQAPTDTTVPAPPVAARLRALRWLKVAIFLTVLAFVIWALVGQFRRIDWAAVRFHPGWAGVSLLLLIGVSTVQMISYRFLLAAYAAPPPWRAMAAVAWIPPLGKYVPGKVAALLGAMYMLRRFAVPAAVAVSVVLVLDGLAVIAGLICGAPLLLTESAGRVLPGGAIYCGIVVATGIVCLHPRVFGSLVNFGLRKLGREPLPKMPDLAHYVVPVLCAFGQWVLAGAALWCMTRSVAGVEVVLFPWFISMAALAMTISYLAVFAPGGLGVREAIYLGTLTAIPGIGPKAAIIVALMRLAQTIVELGLAGIGMGMLRHNTPVSATCPLSGSDRHHEKA